MCMCMCTECACNLRGQKITRHTHICINERKPKFYTGILAKGKDMIIPKFKYSDILVGFSLVPTEGKLFGNGKIKVLGIYYYVEFSSVANTRIWPSVTLCIFFSEFFRSQLRYVHTKNVSPTLLCYKNENNEVCYL